MGEVSKITQVVPIGGDTLQRFNQIDQKIQSYTKGWFSFLYHMGFGRETVKQLRIDRLSIATDLAKTDSLSSEEKREVYSILSREVRRLSSRIDSFVGEKYALKTKGFESLRDKHKALISKFSKDTIDLEILTGNPN